MTYSNGDIWTIIGVMAIATYLVRFSFLGLVGDRKMPEWVLRHLRYTPVAVIPGLIAPLVVWPEATGGEIDPVRMAAACATVVVAWWRGNLLWGAVAGAATFGVLSWFA